MSIFLVMQANDGSERAFAVQKETTTIGRETTCDVRVPVPSVSQKHCQIHVEDGKAKLVDLQSERGTYHNGNRVEKVELANEDRLQVGPVTFIVRVQEDARPDEVPEIVIERQVNQTLAGG